METIATFMQSETAVIALGIAAIILGAVAVSILIVIAAVSTFIGRLPGGLFSLAGIVIIVAMFSFASIMTSTMELQYGPQGAVVENSIYMMGVFLCVLGYARLTWWIIRKRRKEGQQ